MRSRDAWLAAIAAALGVSDAACKRDATNAPAVAKEIASASSSSSSSATVASSAPSETANAEVIASAPLPSATAAPLAATATATPSGGLGGIGIGRINPACGARAACGATATPREPTANVNVQVLDGGEHDAPVAQTQLRARVRNCANNGIRNDPNERGRLVLQIAIDAHGAVTRVDRLGTTIGETTSACMQNAARAVKFPEGTARTIRVQVNTDRGS